MTTPRSIGSFTWCIRLAAVAGSLCAASLLLRGERPARACAGYEPSIAEFTTFDPGVLGGHALDAIYYDPFLSRFGGYQPEQGQDALLADWRGYLKGAASDAEWRKILFEATAADVAALQARLAGTSAVVPKGFERSSLWKRPADKARLGAALALVKLAHDVEPSSAYVAPWGEDPSPGRPARPAPTGLLDVATAGMKAAAADPFLAQRYAFQAVRILFYQGDWEALIQFFDRHTAALTAPSAGLGWRARYYLAGALKHTSSPRAYLELARIVSGYPPLAGPAMSDFHPQSDAEWRDALALAKTPREKAELWRMVGIKFDGVAAAREILKVDPRSDLIALLVVRELARAESGPGSPFSEDPKDKATGRDAQRVVEKLALQVAATPGADRPWLMNLVAGHVAAKRGDLAAARPLLQRAVAGKPGDARVASQARVSLSLALVAHWKIDDAHERELGDAMTAIDSTFERSETATREIRDELAKRYLAANRLFDAEFLRPGTVDALPDGAEVTPFSPHAGKLHWADVGFIQEMIARRARASSSFEHFVAVRSALTDNDLAYELAVRQVLDGNFADARQSIATTKEASKRLDVDPFVTHIKDCRECDEQKYGRSPWTHASVISRLADLSVTASGTGETAAEASIQIGNALYNFSWFGNARRVLRNTHQDGWDNRSAERWYKRAYELTRNKELKAKAAYLAAKAERANRIDTAKPDDAMNNDDPGLPIPKAWFTRLKALSGTRYYQEVLRECGTFRSWVAGPP